MAEHSSVYRWSLKDAVHNNELDLWRESHKSNCACARAIEKAITDNYHDNSLNTDAARDIISEYGYNRVQWVLANTVQNHSKDGRFSPANKEWADKYYIPNDDDRWHFSVGSHPGLVNLFINRVQKEWESLRLYDKSYCSDESHYEDKVLIMKPSTLKDEFKTPDFQLFYATNGFGCDPNKAGTMIAGYFLKDDEYAHFRRSDFLGVMKDECIPEWAQEKLTQYQEPHENMDIKMEGV